MSSSPIEEFTCDTLAEGERVITFAPAKHRVGKQDFAEAAVVLSDRRLFLASADWPDNCEISTCLERDSCFLLNHEELANGAMLLLVCHPGGVLCLYLGPPWNSQAKLIRDSLKLQPVFHQGSMLSPRSETLLRQGLEGFWRERLGTTSSADLAKLARSFVKTLGIRAPADFSLEQDVFAQFRGLALEEETEQGERNSQMLWMGPR